MAPDCCLLFVKGEGVFSSVSALPQVGPKLRVLYEVLPISYLVVKAGGLASTGTEAMSNLVVKGFTQKADIVIGSAEEV